MRPSSRPDTADLRFPESIRDAVGALLGSRHIPGLALAVTSADRLLHAEGFGKAVLQPPQAARADTAWLWFSMSKLVTATAVMRLADHGLLDLDAPFRNYLPDVSDVRSAATIRQLLNHTAGIANPLPIRWVRPADAPECDAQLLTRLNRTIARPRREPGRGAAYTNVGYLVLGRVVETAAGEPFREHIRRHVLEPAGSPGTGRRDRRRGTVPRAHTATCARARRHDDHRIPLPARPP